MRKLNMDEYQDLKDQARQLFINEVLGDKPTYKSIARQAYNPNKINMLQYWGMLLLIVLTAFTSLKMAIVAAPFAQSLFNELASYTIVSPIVITIGTGITMLLFVLIGTPGLIYFKLLSSSDVIKTQKQMTVPGTWTDYISLDYISPRLPQVIVYGILIWLIIVSWHGTGIKEASVFERLLPVVIELGLAYLVSNILEQQRTFRNSVQNILESKLKPYEERLNNYEKDEQYYIRLYRLMSEKIPLLKERSGGRVTYPNKQLLNNDKALREYVIKEYNRLNSGKLFADTILNQTDNTIPIVKEKSERRKPAGDYWTVSELENDLAMRGIKPEDNYTCRQLDKDYAPGHHARKALKNSKYGNYS